MSELWDMVFDEDSFTAVADEIHERLSRLDVIPASIQGMVDDVIEIRGYEFVASETDGNILSIKVAGTPMRLLDALRAVQQ